MNENVISLSFTEIYYRLINEYETYNTIRYTGCLTSPGQIENSIKRKRSAGQRDLQFAVIIHRDRGFCLSWKK